MGHFAKVENGLVTKVIVADLEFFNTFVDSSPGEWIQTSYNTRGGVHYKSDSDEPSEDQSKALRMNYAGVGYTYDKIKDAFIPPKPYDSWVLDEKTLTWKPPIAYPTDVDVNGNRKVYTWNESSVSWLEYIIDK